MSTIYPSDLDYVAHLDLGKLPRVYFTLIINPNPSDAVVTIDEEVTNTITIYKGTEVTYSISKDNYITKTDTITVIEDTTLDIELELDYVTLTINPTPSNSDILINNEEQDSIKVIRNTEVEVSVSHTGYRTDTRTIKVTETSTLDINLVQLDLIVTPIGDYSSYNQRYYPDNDPRRYLSGWTDVEVGILDCTAKDSDGNSVENVRLEFANGTPEDLWDDFPDFGVIAKTNETYSITLDVANKTRYKDYKSIQGVPKTYQFNLEFYDRFNSSSRTITTSQFINSGGNPVTGYIHKDVSGIVGYPAMGSISDPRIPICYGSYIYLLAFYEINETAINSVNLRVYFLFPHNEVNDRISECISLFGKYYDINTNYKMGLYINGTNLSPSELYFDSLGSNIEGKEITTSYGAGILSGIRSVFRYMSPLLSNNTTYTLDIKPKS